jgi:hypothetical protein
MPVPQGITQPQAQAQPEAEGGVASAPVDSEMFNFAPGGIVTFANDVKEKKQLVKDEEEAKAKQREADRRALLEPLAAVGDVIQLPVAAGYNLLADAAGGTEGFLNRIGSALTGENVNTQTDGQVGGKFRFSPTPFTDMLRQPTSGEVAQKQTQQTAIDANPETQKLIRLAANPPAAQNMNPALQPNRNVAPPPPPNVNTGINTGKPPAPAAPAGPPTVIAATMAAMQNMPQQAAFDTAIADARKSVEGTTREQKIKDELELQKTLGIGTFDKQQQQMYEDNKARQAKIEAGRGERDFLAQLATYSRPGANFSQVAERDIANKTAHMLEDQKFADSQNKLLTDIQSTAEARRVGTANTIRTAEATEKKTKQEMLNYIMKELGVNLQVAQKILGDTLQAQVQMRSQDMQYKVGMANVDAKLEIASVKADMANQKLAATMAGMDTANKIKLSNSDPYKKLEARIAGLDQQIKYQTNPDGTPKDVEKMGKLKTDLADLKTQQATLATNILGGGGISTLPASAPPPGAVREVKK